MKPAEERGFRGYGKTYQTVILSSSEGSRSERFRGNARFFVGRRSDLLRMTMLMSFSAASEARSFLTHLEKSAFSPDTRAISHFGNVSPAQAIPTRACESSII